MSEYNHLGSYRDLPLELLHAIMGRISLHSTVLVRQRRDGGWTQNGSGTFVRNDGKFGILTAGHVVRGHRRTEAIGLCVGSGDHLFQLECRHVEICEEYRTPGELPDLGFIRIPSELAGAVEARQKMFYSIEPKRKDILSVKEDLHCGVWALWGAPDEQTTIQVSTREHGIVQCFSCLAGFTGCEPLVDVGPWDALQASVDYLNCSAGVPRSMEGFSGGGLWCIQLRRNAAGEIEPSEYLLEGVACLQSALANEQRTITCHGPRGVLDFLDQSTSNFNSNAG